MNTKNIAYTFLGICILAFNSTLGQVSEGSPCNFSVQAGNDTTICSGSTVLLSGTFTAPESSVTEINWFPGTGISDPDISNPIASPLETTTYIFSVTAAGETNLIINGDFSEGDASFTSDYVPGTGGISGTISTEGQYDINTNPHDSHIDFATFGDHTSGTGNMMIVNGAATMGEMLWCQTVTVSPGEDYSLSAWGRTCNWQNPAMLQFYVEGEAVGSTLYLTADTTVWKELTAIWNAGTATSAEVCLRDLSTWSAGNDFAIDDIAFVGSCGSTMSDTITITVVPLTPPVIAQLGDILSVPDEYTTYQWFKDGDVIAGATSSSITATTSGAYTVQVTNEEGCAAESAAFTIQLHNNIADYEKQNLHVFPNPSNGNLTINCSLNGPISLQILNMTGDILFQTLMYTPSVSIDTGNFPSGMYFVKVSNSSDYATLERAIHVQ